MGEYAEMMLDGTCCEGCGTFMGEAPGHPRYCSTQCAVDRGANIRDFVVPKRKAKAARTAAQLAAHPLGAKSLRWLTLATAGAGDGMYPGVRADAAPGVFRKLERRGFVAFYAPHNAAHKDRYVATEAGRAAIAATLTAPAPQSEEK